MIPVGSDIVRQTIDSVYRSESRRVFASLVRLLGGFDLAEEALQDAFAAALDRWPCEGVPANPRAWLISAGLFLGLEKVGVDFTPPHERLRYVRGQSRRFQVHCESQEEIDYYWDKLGAGGDPRAQQCGWLKDKFGLSRPIVPSALAQMMQDTRSRRMRTMSITG
jgi:predicted 3-demethylubiquinone-9 3-methyltransferase (glyoxalase superfamily)